MLLDDVSDILSTGGITRPIYKLHVPAQAQDSAVLLTPMGGLSSLQTMSTGPSGPNVVTRPRVRVTCRDLDYSIARTVAHVAFRLTDGFRATTVNQVSYLWMSAVSSPRYLGTDGNGRSLVGFDLDILRGLQSPAFAPGTFASPAFAATYSE